MNMRLAIVHSEVQQAIIIVLNGLHKDTPSHVHRIVKKADEEEEARIIKHINNLRGETT